MAIFLLSFRIIILNLKDFGRNNQKIHIMEIRKELWGKTPCGKEMFLYTLINGKGAYAQVSNVGAGIVSVVVPDRDGVLADVVLGYPEPESYFGDGPCAGKVPGRYANRIALGHFTLDGVEYTLPICSYSRDTYRQP